MTTISATEDGGYMIEIPGLDGREITLVFHPKNPNLLYSVAGVRGERLKGGAVFSARDLFDLAEWAGSGEYVIRIEVK